MSDSAKRKASGKHAATDRNGTKLLVILGFCASLDEAAMAVESFFFFFAFSPHVAILFFFPPQQQGKVQPAVAATVAEPSIYRPCNK